MAEPAFIIHGKRYPLPAAFTLGERADMELITGQGYDLTKPGALGTLAMAFVAVKRVEPNTSVEEIKALGDDDIEVVGVEDEEPVPPTSPQGSNGSDDSSTGTFESGSEATPEQTPVSSGTSA